MRRKIIRVTIVILITILSFVFSLFIHELGHSIMSMICLKVPPSKFYIGIESYVLIPAYGASEIDLAMISIGSMVLQELIYLILLIFKNVYIDIVRIVSACSLYVHIIFSIAVLIFGSKQPETYDLLLFQKYLNLDSKIMIIGLIILLLINIIFEWKNKGFKRIIDELSD